MTPGTVAGFAGFTAATARGPGASCCGRASRCAADFRCPSISPCISAAAFLPQLPTPRETFSAPDSARLCSAREAGSSSGELYSNPDLAATLERLVDSGPDDFYRGAIAGKIADAFEQNGGFVTRGDLEQYRVSKEAPLRGRYRGYDVVASPCPPAA